MTTSVRELRELLERAITAIEPRHPTDRDKRWQPSQSRRAEPPAFTRRFRLEFSPRGHTDGGAWGSGTVDTTVELAVVTDYAGEPELIEELAEVDWQDLRRAINAAKNPDVGLIAITYIDSPFEDPGAASNGALVQIAHIFELRYRAAY